MRTNRNLSILQGDELLRQLDEANDILELKTT
jgi:hypothetical protein